MKFTETDLRRFSLLLLIILLGILVFFIVKPIFFAIVAGLILAYVFFPVYSFILRIFRYKTISAIIVCVCVLLMIILPLWFLIPLIIQRVFDLFLLSQKLDVGTLIKDFLPTASDQLVNQISLTADNAVSKLSSFVISSFTDFLLNFGNTLLKIVLVAFVFFFALRDSEELTEFISGISPINKAHERVLVKQFKDITDSIVYGQIVIGIVQGILAGLGLFLFDVPNALVLTLLAVILSIIPLIGPAFVYIPIAIYLLATSTPTLAITYILYNLLLVSTIDNIMRIYFVSKKAQLSQVIALIGMVGGLLVFGLLGLLIGPLIIAYFITFLKAFKEKTLSTLFEEE
ncbi:AI-2E family transporter [Candidatus Pacearchaeota archaeon]|nr:AI-2E family transporter [Candidatus Pacearchaeota archaeon]